MKPILKQILLLFFGVFISFQVISQSEFPVYTNGLIYTQEAMTKLGNVVTSLNLKYKTCDVNTVYYSKFQAKGYIVNLEKEDIISAKNDMDNSISIEEFIIKYPKAKIKETLILKSSYLNREKEDLIKFNAINISDDYDYSFDLTINYNDYINKSSFKKWMYKYRGKITYKGKTKMPESIKAFYFSEDFISTPLPKKYNLQIGYADCLIDTSSAKFKNDAKSGWISLPENWQKLSTNEKTKLLDTMRSIKVIGSCSMDESPRIHAVNIALLSAETTNWEVFLKSHLDILNDRFERSTDASYAREQRNTYIKELEELNINVVDLILGTSLRIENQAKNHYYGNISRLGRAIAESKYKKEFKEEILKMIEDDKLDDYNRAIAYFLFENLNYYTIDKTEQKNNTEELKNSIHNLPNHLKS